MSNFRVRRRFFVATLSLLIVSSSATTAQDTLRFEAVNAFSAHQSAFEDNTGAPVFVIDDWLYSYQWSNDTSAPGVYDVYNVKENVHGLPVWLGQVNFDSGRGGEFQSVTPLDDGFAYDGTFQNVRFANHRVLSHVEDGFEFFKTEVTRWGMARPGSDFTELEPYDFYRHENWVVDKLDFEDGFSYKDIPFAGVIGAFFNDVYGEVLVMPYINDLVFANYTEGTTGAADVLSRLFAYQEEIGNEIEHTAYEDSRIESRHWQRISGTKYVLIADSNWGSQHSMVHFIDVSDPKRPVITESVRIERSPYSSSMESAAVAGYLFLSDGVRCYVVGEEGVLQVIEPESFNYIDMQVVGGYDSEFDIETFEALYLFQEGFSTTDVYKYEQSAGPYGTEYRPIELVAQATDVGSDEFGYWRSGRVMLSDHRFVQEMVLPQEGSPNGYTLYSISEGTSTWSEPNLATDITGFRLGFSAPNPTNASAHIDYEIPQEAHVRLEVFNMLGRRVDVVVDEQQAPGRHSATIDASRLPSGTYTFRIDVDGISKSRRLVVLR